MKTWTIIKSAQLKTVFLIPSFDIEQDWKENVILIHYRGCFPKFANGLHIKISIVQKVDEWPSISFAKMITSLGDEFAKGTAWSLIYFLKYAYFDI